MPFVIAGVALLAVAAVVTAYLLSGWIKSPFQVQSVHTIIPSPITGQVVALPTPETQLVCTITPPPVTVSVGVPATTALPQATISASSVPTPDIAELQTLMLGLINADRATEGLPSVQWDAFAAQMGQAHADDMAVNGYMSHWNLAGEGPDIRYGRAGGTDAVQENVYMYWWRYDDGRPAPLEDWEVVIREAEEELMNSPGHRANIMAPEHTHVGIGIAYNAATGDVRIAQEFLNRYILMDPLPKQARVGDMLTVRGQLLSDASNPLINLVYEPFPQPMTVLEVEARETYRSPAGFVLAIEPEVDTVGQFSAYVTLDANSQPGVYHVLIWVDVGDASVQAVDAVIDVVN